MGYRNIEVDGVQYQYAVGRSHTKITGLGVFLNKNYGTPVGYHRFRDPTTSGQPLPEGQIGTYVISPSKVRAMILHKTKGIEPQSYRQHCLKHDYVVTSLTPSPFAGEIEGKGTLMWNCPECVEDNAMEI
jgi:hypothetical protein